MKNINSLVRKFFAASFPVIAMFLFTSCNSEISQPESTVTRYALVSADSKTLPCSVKFTGTPYADTAWVSVFQLPEGVELTDWFNKPANNTIRLKAGRSWGYKTGVVYEATGETFDTGILHFTRNGSTITAENFSATITGDTLVYSLQVYNEIVNKPEISHNFLLKYAKSITAK